MLPSQNKMNDENKNNNSGAAAAAGAATIKEELFFRISELSFSRMKLVHLFL
jgi:hypothetical protein